MIPFMSLCLTAKIRFSHYREDTSPTFKAFEEGSTTLSKEENTKLAERQAKFILNLNNALIRIDNHSYGICRITGKLISKERLTLVPHATLSIEAKKAQLARFEKSNIKRINSNYN